MTESWTVLVNPRAGRRRQLEDRVRTALASVSVGGTVILPDGEPAMRAAVRDSIDVGNNHIAVVGGDGTLSLVVDELMRLDLETPPVVAILPAGTGSDFARPFAIPQHLEGAVHHLAGTTDYPVDVGFVEGAWGKRAFINVAEVGLLASCAGLAGRLPTSLGRLKYQVAFWATLPRFRPSEIELTAGNRSFSGPALIALFANGQFFGGGFNVAPKAAVMDGILDVQVITAKRREALQLFPMVKRGLHLRHEAVRRFRSSTFALTSSDPWPVEVDGDVIGTTPVSGWVESGRLLLRL